MSEPTNQDYLDVADMLDDEPIKGEHLLPHNPNRTKAETRRLLTERDIIIKQFNIVIKKQRGEENHVENANHVRDVNNESNSFYDCNKKLYTYLIFYFYTYSHILNAISLINNRLFFFNNHL